MEFVILSETLFVVAAAIVKIEDMFLTERPIRK
jgi:hypothetical protein